MPLPWLASWDSFALGLESEGKSPETLRVYRTSVDDFGRHLISEKGNVPHLDAVSREDVRRYLAALAKARKEPASRHMRFRSLRRFFGWLAAEGDIELNPVEGVGAPQLDHPSTPVLSDADVQRLLKTCAGGRDFAERRDYALLRILLEGPRRGEIVSMRIDPEYLSLREDWALVSGKSGDRVLALAGRRPTQSTATCAFAASMHTLRARHSGLANAARSMLTASFDVLQMPIPPARPDNM